MICAIFTKSGKKM